MSNSRDLAAILVGAVIGGVAGFLFFTDRGRRVSRQIEPALDDVARELMSFRATVQKAGGVAGEGWTLFTEAFGERQAAPTFPGRQTSPF